MHMIKKGCENIHVISNSRIHTTCWNTTTRAQARTRGVWFENILMISYSRIHTSWWHPTHTYHLLTHCNHFLTPYTHIPLTDTLHTHTTYWHPAHMPKPRTRYVEGVGIYIRHHLLEYIYHLLTPYTHIPIEIYIRHHSVEYMHQSSSVGCESARTISYSRMHTTYWHSTHVPRHRRRCAEGVRMCLQHHAVEHILQTRCVGCENVQYRIVERIPLTDTLHICPGTQKGV